MSGTEAIAAGAFFIGLGWFLLALALFIIVIKYTNKQKTYEYRKYLMNLFICGKIKQAAEKHKVNLDDMKLDYEKYYKMSSKERIRDLDDKIEQDLIDDIDIKEVEKEKIK